MAFQFLSVDNDDTYDHDGNRHFDDHDFAAVVPEGNMPAEQTKSNVKVNEGVTAGLANEEVSGGEANEGVIGGVFGAAETPVVNDSNTWYDNELTNEVLVKLNMSQIVLHRQHVKKEDMTLEELARKKFPTKCVSSPFVVDFGYDISGTSNSAPKCISEETYSFVKNIDEFDPYSPEGRAFAEFVDDGMNSTQM
ncbi:uncharacterized protein LOC132057079 isoform X2 [Lycium ferocissimum]|uniref:uncharacterized protein LOC132057079 isoform X2 n=1 Tax=Lycium ferocissimum TaxID=112874 RepID=UPI00281592A8|nr:uncharacterized protein LOC132057079 isoform X2 [Lycium ferocissimum]